MTTMERVEALANEIALRSVPASDAPFTEWSTDALRRRIKDNAATVLLDWMLLSSDAD